LKLYPEQLGDGWNINPQKEGFDSNKIDKVYKEFSQKIQTNFA